MVQLSHETAAREFLNSARGLELEIAALRHERNLLLSRGFVSPPPSPVREPRKPDAVGERLAAWTQYGLELEARERQLVERRRAVHAAIDAVPDALLRTILIERYLNFRSFTQIAALVHYDYYHVIKILHKRALALVPIRN